MKILRFVRAAVLLGLFVCSVTFARATDCDTDCHKRCRRCAFGACLIEPTCHLQCEIEKKAACAIRSPVPHVPSTNEILTNPTQACAPPFEAFTNPVIAYCANWPGRADDLHLVEHAKATLIRAQLVAPWAFSGVDIRWCPLSNGSGMAPARNRILLHPDRKHNAFGLAVLLAHEMKHKEQWDRWGDDFKCRYGGQMLQGRGQGRGNDVEREAYEFEDHAARVLSPLFAANGAGSSPTSAPMPLPMMSQRCVMPMGACPMAMPGPVGASCWCPSPGGPIGGRIQ